MPRPPIRRARLAAQAGLATRAFLVPMALVPAPAIAGPTIGFVEDFQPPDSLAGWNSQATNSNPRTGGVGGTGDGYLRIARAGFEGQLGAKNVNADYAGNWLSGGADRVKFSLNDVDGDQNLEIHFVVGSQNSFWLYELGFIPPENKWVEFTVDLSDTASFTNIIDFTGQSFSEALTGVDRVQIRHDVAPFIQNPDLTIGDFGVDDFKIESTTVGVDPARPARGRPVMLAPPFPNPTRGNAVFAFETFDEAPVTIAVVDARGRIVRRESVAAGTAGRHTWTWDGRDSAGRLTAAGVYRVRAFGPAGGTSRPLVRID